MLVINDIEQGTAEWHDARRCKISGTKLKKIMGTALNRFELIAELIAEEGTEQSNIMRPTQEMERGSAEEVFAIKLFEKQTGKKVEQVGLCVSEEFEWAVLSPDGLIKDAQGKYSEAIEVKSPNSATLIKYRLANLLDQKATGLTASQTPFLGVPADYKWQVVHYFVVNQDLRKLHFVTYDERFIESDKKLYIVEVNWENEVLQEAINEAREALKKFRGTWLEWKELVLPSNF